jgi:hypothetical protein
MRSFDPRKVGGLACEAWVTYYRREWRQFLRAAVSLTRHTFGLPWPATLYGAWLVLRANQLWPPYPDNQPARARECVRRFYALVARRHGERFDVSEAAGSRSSGGGSTASFGARTGTLTRTRGSWSRPSRPSYAHVYGVERHDVRWAAEQRALAMRDSDQWVEEGCKLDSPLIESERAALVRSYAALLAAVHRGGAASPA